VVAGIVAVTVVATGLISAWVGLVHPAKSAQKRSTIHVAAIVVYLMNNLSFFDISDLRIELQRRWPENPK
jgi:hypothetical protein